MLIASCWLWIQLALLETKTTQEPGGFHLNRWALLRWGSVDNTTLTRWATETVALPILILGGLFWGGGSRVRELLISWLNIRCSVTCVTVTLKCLQNHRAQGVGPKASSSAVVGETPTAPSVEPKGAAPEQAAAEEQAPVPAQMMPDLSLPSSSAAAQPSSNIEDKVEKYSLTFPRRKKDEEGKNVNN